MYNVTTNVGAIDILSFIVVMFLFHIVLFWGEYSFMNVEGLVALLWPTKNMNSLVSYSIYFKVCNPRDINKEPLYVQMHKHRPL